MPTFSDNDEGKRVVDARGEKIGMVKSVREGQAYVDPDPDLTDSIKSKLGWDAVDQEDYALNESRVDDITDDEVRLGDLGEGM